jgi:hypothetical protein
MMSFEDRKKLYNACNPEQALEPGDPRNVDLDAWQRSSEPVRGTDWVGQLARDFELADAPILRLFSGLPGSGKSTELRRLAVRLAAPSGAHLLPVLVDTEMLLDLRERIEVSDLLVAMLYEAERATLSMEGQDPALSLKEGVFSHIWGLLTRARAEPTKAEIGGPGVGVKVVFDLKTNPELRERIRSIVQGNRAAILHEINEAFLGLQRRVNHAGYSGLVLLVDSLEKLRGMSDNFEAVLKSAEQIFAGGAPYLRVPVHSLFTVPPALVLRLSDDVRLLPMIKLHTRQGAVFEAGFEAASEIIRKRVPQPALDDIFGPIEAGARLRELIEESGGYPREILRILQAILSARAFPLGEREHRRILLGAGDAYRRVALGRGDRALWLLARVHVTKKLLVNDADRELLDHLVATNLILRYQNDNDWADIHPAVAQLDLVQHAIKRLQRGEIIPDGAPITVGSPAPG